MDPPPDGRIIMTRLRWLTGERLTPIHAARCYAIGARAVDQELIGGIAPSMDEFNHRLAAAEIDINKFWRRLLSAAAAGDNDLESCASALFAAGCSSLTLDSIAAALASRLAEIRLVHQERFPKLAEQLALRGRPLREQWDGYGAGLMKRIGKLTHASFLPKQATALLLSPYRGGDGGIDASAARVWIEAVLTNPFPQVPEVLRLAWLIAQIGLIDGLSAHSDDSHGDPWVAPARLPRVAALAMLPIALDAGVYLELIPTPQDGLSSIFPQAANAWRFPIDSATLDVLENWWRQFQDLQTAPPVTLKALDRMLHAETMSDDTIIHHGQGR